MRQIQLLRVSVVTLAILCTATTFSAGIYSGGTGDQETPFQISSIDDLLEMRDHPEDWSQSFELTNNIDLTGQIFNKALIAWDTSSDGLFQGTKFTGDFNGLGHTISNFTINLSGSTEQDFLGFIGYGQDCTIQNLSLESASITANPSSGVCGIFAAYLVNATIQGCTVTGTINSWTLTVGGLIGYNQSGDISQCLADATVSGTYNVGGLIGFNKDSIITRCCAAGSVNATQAVGGLVGHNDTCTITQCYASGNVTATDMFAGGLSGENLSSTFIQCYSTGTVSTIQNSGGLLGSNSYTGIVFNSYWDTQTSGRVTSAGGEGRTTEQMQQASNYTGWSGWTIDEEVDYPHLEWENTTGTPMTFTRNYPGNGIVEDPFRISSKEQLVTFFLAMDDWDDHIMLLADIDLGFMHPNRMPLEFFGFFNGMGHTISNLTIDTTSQFVGLFRIIRESGVIQNLSMDAFVIKGEGYVGSLAGSNYGTIHHCHAAGAVNGLYYDYTHNIGGVAGINYGTIHHCSTSIDITSYRHSYNIGGLAGGNANSGHIYLCSASGTIDGQWETGGLVGFNSGIIEQSYTEGTVTSCSESYHDGGLVGANRGTIRQCYSTASITADDVLGGLVGINDRDGIIEQSYATGSVNGTKFSYEAGGLVGRNHAQIRQCYAAGPVDAETKPAGLIADLSGDQALIEDSFWDVTTTQMSIGYNQSETNPGTAINVNGLTTEQMKQKANFIAANWEFVNDDTNGTNDVWRLCIDGTHYPQLAWQSAQAGDLSCPDECGIEDLEYLSYDWLLETADDQLILADINGDGIVNQKDFLILAQNWMTE